MKKVLNNGKFLWIFNVLYGTAIDVKDLLFLGVEVEKSQLALSDLVLHAVHVVVANCISSLEYWLYLKGHVTVQFLRLASYKGSMLLFSHFAYVRDVAMCAKNGPLFCGQK